MPVLRKKSVEDVEVSGRWALVRVDFNVPMSEGEITDDRRIRASLKTIRYLLDHRAVVILASHFGRPKGKDPSLSLKPVAKRLSELIGQPVRFLDDCVGPAVEEAVKSGKPGDLFLLENLRFHPEEEANDPRFSARLAGLAGLYVNDAFGTAHRAHASTVGVTKYLPAVSGYLMQEEISALSEALEDPARPLVAIVGGAKVSSKIAVIQHLLPRVDRILIGGGLANTFFKAQGLEIGKSLVENDYLDTARQIVQQAGHKLVLPADVVIASKAEAGAEQQTVSTDAVPAQWMILDLGPKTVERFAGLTGSAGTVIWNGPLGLCEIPDFARGTHELARRIAGQRARVVVGGGDLVGALEDSGVIDKLGHVSTGGGASLEFLEGRELPGVAALEDR